jgi:hypothetical protein
MFDQSRFCNGFRCLCMSFRHLVFMHSVRSVFSCQPWGNNIHA